VAIFLKFLLFLAKMCFGPAIWPHQLSEIAVTLVRLEEQVLPDLVDAQSAQHRVHVQYSSMHADLTTLAKRLLRRTQDPHAALNSALFVLNLLVIFHIVADDKVRTHTIPHCTTNLLLSAASQDAEAVTIAELHDDFRLLLRLEAHDIEVPTQIFVRVDLFRDVR